MTGSQQPTDARGSQTTQSIFDITKLHVQPPFSALRLRFLITVVALNAVVLTSLGAGAPPDEKRISIFSTIASYALPVADVGGTEYVGLLEALEPLGAVSARADRKHWRLRYNNNELQFDLDKTRVKMKDGNFDLGAPFVMQSDRGLVPTNALAPLMFRILGGPVSFNPASRRIFIGNVAVHFTAQVSGSVPPSLVMNFTAPVNPTIATDAGKLKMTFTHEPVVSSGTQTLTFSTEAISSATYQDGNGNAAITVAGSSPLFASFSGDRKTITITTAAAAAKQVQAATPHSDTAAPAATTSQPQASAAPLAYFAVVDASHGGADRGATLTEQKLEKDVTLQFAQLLKKEMESRGITALLLRSADADLSVDQRAGAANAAHPSIYICIHATSQGSGVNLYSALLPPANPSRGPFLDWATAQALALTKSQAALEILAGSLRNSKILVRKLAAPLRPLNNITAPAVAVEIAPRFGGASRLDSPGYQASVAAAIAAGVATLHDKGEGAQ